MRLLAKIRALFMNKEEPKEMELAAAEIRGNKVFLHPAGDKDTTICMRAESVDIHINPGSSVDDTSIFFFHKKKPGTEKSGGTARDGTETQQKILPPGGVESKNPKAGMGSGDGARQENPYKVQMKTISFRVYPEEYEVLMEIINSNGYRKAEYLLACVHAAKKKSMETVYAQYYDAHQERRRADRAAAKRFRAEQQVQIQA